jgi:hypothetical protein
MYVTEKSETLVTFGSSMERLAEIRAVLEMAA